MKKKKKKIKRKVSSKKARSNKSKKARSHKRSIKLEPNKKVIEGDKRNFFPYFIIFSIFIAFVLLLSILKDFNIPLTGNAISNFGNLNPNYTFAVLVIISIYTIITCSYLSLRDKI